MIRRTFLSAISALAVAPLGWLFGRKPMEPDLAIEIGTFSLVGESDGLSVKWWKSDGRIDVCQISTGRALRCIEKTDDGWFTFQSDRAGIRMKIDRNGIGTITWVDYVWWKEPCEPQVPLVYGVKDSTKPTGFAIDWLAWNECSPGEPQA